MKNHRSTAELKAMAREQMLGKYGTAIGITVVVQIISTILSVLTGWNVDTQTTSGMILSYTINLVLNLILSVLSVGMTYFYMNVCRDKEYRMSNLFWALSHHPDKAILVTLFLLVMNIIVMIPFGAAAAAYVFLGKQTLYILLMTLALIFAVVGMFYLVATYATIYNVLVDNYEAPLTEIIRQSHEMMKGHRLRYFYLTVSFIGWCLLALVSCGIGMLWVTPYMAATSTYFYLDITGELDAPKTMEEPTVENLFENLYR